MQRLVSAEKEKKRKKFLYPYFLGRKKKGKGGKRGKRERRLPLFT